MYVSKMELNFNTYYRNDKVLLDNVKENKHKNKRHSFNFVYEFI